MKSVSHRQQLENEKKRRETIEREKEQMLREKEELLVRLQEYEVKTQKAEKGKVLGLSDQIMCVGFHSLNLVTLGLLARHTSIYLHE